MDLERLSHLLESVAAGLVDTESALQQLRDLPFEDLEFAKIDYHRSLRKGYPETIFCAGKTPEQVAIIAERMVAHNSRVLGTRCSPEMFSVVKEAVPEALYHEAARAFTCGEELIPASQNYVAVICAGTSDIPVAEEAVLTCQVMGVRAERIYDVGVAGIHRLFEQRTKISEAVVAIVCAGMEGALPSVVAGLTPTLVIAVPTSVGYGASFNGIAALLGMLNSCATGLTVVNIDNGFGAAVAACTIVKRMETMGNKGTS
ncbi:MAG: nickel pincer cofactor biosynthesis protein LarB [Candidatus Hydrogenedentes bacterium]|jgi:NCAIR mutase (PurE)-related protein|nr:nickel pincer cofactor biosynthesis protein LarB [Candidatus Hydrogenedentota bacterium]